MITDTDTIYGDVDNISRGGVLIFLDEKLKVGDNVRLAIEISDCHDIITARGEVVSTRVCQRGSAHGKSFSIALKFTEITKENLKFFTGNFAPEWTKSYQDRNAGRKNSIRSIWSNNRSLVFIILALLIIPSAYLLLSGDEKMTDAVNSSMDDQAEELKQLLIYQQKLEAKIDSISEKADQMTGELSRIQAQLSILDSQESPIKHKVNPNSNIAGSRQNEMPGGISKSKETGAEKTSDTNYYIVKKGENLYRVSLKTGIPIDRLMQLNNIDSGSVIFPGQKLFIK